MSEMKDILDSMNRAADTLNMASKVTKDITTLGNSYNRRKQIKESGELEQIMLETEKYCRKSAILIICCIVLWAMLIISTIIFCVTGNDIVLRLLHI